MAFFDPNDVGELEIDRVRRDPKKALLGLLRGMGRGVVTGAADLADLAARGTPSGAVMPPGNTLGGVARELLRDTPLRETGAAAEQVGELVGPPGKLLGKLGGLSAIMVPAKRAIAAGKLHPDALIDALRMHKAGRDPNEIWSQTMVDVSKPGVMPGAQTHAMTAIETPGYSQGPAPGGPLGMSRETLANRLKSGDVKGLEPLLELYPEMANMPITKTMHGGEGVLGGYDPRNKSILLNYGGLRGKDLNTEFPGVLGHEGYHGGPEAIDKLPPGANPGDAGQRQGTGQIVLDRGAQNLEAALAARGMLEDRGGKLPILPQPEMMRMYEMARTKGTPRLNSRALAMALKNDSGELTNRLDLVTQLQGKISSDPVRAYLKTWGERNARASEFYAGKPKDVIRQTPPRIADRENIPPEELYDIREFSPAVWKKLGLL